MQCRINLSPYRRGSISISVLNRNLRIGRCALNCCFMHLYVAQGPARGRLFEKCFHIDRRPIGRKPSCSQRSGVSNHHKMMSGFRPSMAAQCL